MHTLAALLRNTVLALVPFHLSSAAFALTCEELRSSVETKIQGKGVTRFTVSIVEVGAPAAGQVVGTCERGSKKLVYAQGNGQSSLPIPLTPPAKQASAPRSRVITECADGRVITQGSCKR
jgi:Protein of unknown function (DUF1161)